MWSTSGANRGVDASNKLNDNVVIATEIHISTQPAGNNIVTFIKLIFTEIIYY